MIGFKIFASQSKKSPSAARRRVFSLTERKFFAKIAFRDDFMEKNTIIHPETGEKLYRDVRPNEFKYKGESITMNMPGWYQINGDDAIFSQEDMLIHDKALRILKERVKSREKNIELGRNMALAKKN